MQIISNALLNRLYFNSSWVNLPLLKNIHTGRYTEMHFENIWRKGFQIENNKKKFPLEIRPRLHIRESLDFQYFEGIVPVSKQIRCGLKS